jgi:hypothetical protein
MTLVTWLGSKVVTMINIEPMEVAHNGRRD